MHSDLRKTWVERLRKNKTLFCRKECRKLLYGYWPTLARTQRKKIVCQYNFCSRNSVHAAAAWRVGFSQPYHTKEPYYTYIDTSTFFKLLLKPTAPILNLCYA